MTVTIEPVAYADKSVLGRGVPIRCAQPTGQFGGCQRKANRVQIRDVVHCGSLLQIILTGAGLYRKRHRKPSVGLREGAPKCNLIV